MLDKQVQKPNLVVLNFRHCLVDLIRDEIGAPRLGLEGKLLLGPSHGFDGVCARAVTTAEEGKKT